LLAAMLIVPTWAIGDAELEPAEAPTVEAIAPVPVSADVDLVALDSAGP
jgi:hypothetical protein